MNGMTFEPGRIVFSRKGRDKGRYFVVLYAVDDHHVMIADGCLRKVEHPKKKKVIHLEAKPQLLESVRQKLADGKTIFDSEVRNLLEAEGYTDSLPPRKEG